MNFAALVGKVKPLRAKQKESEKALEDLFQSLAQKAPVAVTTGQPRLSCRRI